MGLLATKVLDARRVAGDVLHLKLEVPRGFAWKTGEYAGLALEVEGQPVMRLYSIASPAGSPSVDFIVTRAKGGTLSPRLHALASGDEVLIEQKTGGTLLPDRLAPKASDLWLFASGSGIAPFLAMAADSSVMESFERVIVVHGARTWDDAGYVARMIARSPKLRLLSAVTREKDAAIPKRIPLALEDGTLERFAQASVSPEASRVMVCGNPGLVEGLMAVLAQKGFATGPMGCPGLVLVESFGG